MFDEDMNEVRVREKTSVGGKILLSMIMGLLFGIFAGVGLYAVVETTDLLDVMKSKLGQQPQQETVGELPAQPGDAYLEAPKELENKTVFANGAQGDISEVAKKVMPSMVSVVEEFTVTDYGFWGQTTTQNRQGSGSGILIGETEEEYLIVTNNHVVADAESLEVTFIDETTVEAHLKGLDAEKDLAVIAVQKKSVSKDTASKIQIATMGDSDALVLGQQVVAIGNALGYGQSVTSGIVSALNRELNFEDVVGQFIQTDTAINEGNSGGALLDMKGEVIGINSCKLVGGTVEGISYAIPISSVKDIISELMSMKTRIEVDEADTGYIGITMQTVTEEYHQFYGTPIGIFIREVTQDSPAEKAGLLSGDILIKFDGQKVLSGSDLQKLLRYYSGGDTVTVTYMRMENGEYVEHEAELTLGYRSISMQ